jgi:hypothetical protein
VGIEVALIDEMAGGKTAQRQQKEESHGRHATGRGARDNPVSGAAGPATRACCRQEPA